MDPNLSTFLPIDALARATPWLNGPMVAVAQYGGT